MPDETAHGFAPGIASPHQRASVLRRLGRNAEAIACIEGALSSEGSNAAEYHNSALEADRLGRQDLRLLLAERAVALLPSDHEINLNYSDALSKLGRVEEATSAFQRLVDRFPGSPKVLSFLVDHFVRHGETESARNVLDRLAGLTASSLHAAKLYRQDLRSYRHQLNLSDAEYAELLTRLAENLDVLGASSTEQKYELASVFAIIASTLADLGNLTEARENYLKALELGIATSPQSLTNLAADLKVYWRVPDLALRVRRLAFELNPDDGALWENFFQIINDYEAIAPAMVLQMMEIGDGRERLRVLDSVLPSVVLNSGEVIQEVKSVLTGPIQNLSSTGAQVEGAQEQEPTETETKVLTFRTKKVAG